MNSMNCDVAIIGGGAAGLACAVRLSARRDIKIVVIEAGARAGKKLAATGNGQGNVSNLSISAENFRSGNMALVKKIACGDWREGLDVFSDFLFCADERGRVYPSGRQASALTDSLLSSLKVENVRLLLSTRVTKIEKCDTKGGGNETGGRDFPIKITFDGGQILCRYAVLATGGKAQRQFLTDGSAYSLAQMLGHKITPLYPSLVQLKTDTTDTKTLKGIRADCNVCALSDDGVKKCARGDVIFTDYGLSGNAIFSISPLFAASAGEIFLDLLPDFEEGEIANIISDRILSGKERGETLSGLVHNQIGRAVMRRADRDAQKTGRDLAEFKQDIAKNSNNLATYEGTLGDGKAIAHILKNFSLRVTGTLGFDYAQVTCGGVDMQGVDENLQSKIVRNLYFAGEILDVDGDCGGYNLHWAFTSAKTVAEAILSSYDKA